MASDWEIAPLGEVADVVMGLSPKGDTYNEERRGAPLLNGPTEFGPRHPQAILYTTDPARFAEPGDILFCVRGSTTGRMNWADRQYAIGRGIAAIRAKTNSKDTYFVYCCICESMQRLLSFTSGSVFPNLSTGDINAFEIPWPEERTRSSIAHVLGTLDDRIELNRRMNRTLEKMAAAIFKSWFIDFDPVRAKAEGRDTGLPQDIADLFPDEFEDSELGKIPKGWRVSSLGDLVEFAYGKALKEENRTPGSVPVFGSNGQVGWHNEKLVDGPGIVVGRKGNPGIVTWASTDFFCIDTTFYVVPKGECSSLHFLYYALRAHDLAALGADSAVPGLNRNLAYMSRQLVPSQAVVVAFDNHIQKLFAKRSRGDEQVRTLAAIRDTLLPKLLSGELEVPAIDDQVREMPHG